MRSSACMRCVLFFFSSRRRHTRSLRDWSSDVCSSDLDVRAFVPQIAMSAGTMIACSCKEIFMGKHSNLGPVDPQINGLHAYAVVEQLERSEERRVGKECRSRWSSDHEKKKECTRKALT